MDRADGLPKVVRDRMCRAQVLDARSRTVMAEAAARLGEAEAILAEAQLVLRRGRLLRELAAEELRDVDDSKPEAG